MCWRMVPATAAAAAATAKRCPSLLQVGNVDMLNCYYAHGDESEDVRLQVPKRHSVTILRAAPLEPPAMGACAAHSCCQMPAKAKSGLGHRRACVRRACSGDATGCWKQTRTSCWCTTCRPGR